MEWSNYRALSVPLLLILLLLSVAVLWGFPKIYVSSLQKKLPGRNQSDFDRERERLKLEDDTRKTLAQIIGGTFVLFGLAFTFDTYQLNVEKQNFDRENQINERLTKAVAQLSDQNSIVQFGGLSALERLATDYPGKNLRIIETISTYTREKSQIQKSATAPGPVDQKKQSSLKGEYGPNNNGKTLNIGIQAALSLILRLKRVPSPEIPQIDLTNAHLSGAILSSANFSGATLFVTDFSWSVLKDADFTGAAAFRADFSHSILVRNHFDGSDLNNSTFDGADLGSSSFAGARMTNVNLSSANLRFVNFTKAALRGTNFKGADLEGANFRGARLEFAELDLEQLRKVLIDAETVLPKNLESYKPELVATSSSKLLQSSIPLLTYEE
jgi:uncharacterized protein YjbI with pentapeptide repeats